MSFLTGYMETMLSMATDPEEIELRRKVLEDHVAVQEQLIEQRRLADIALAELPTDETEAAEVIIDALPDTPAAEEE
jgi:hypothetical protein